MSQIPRRTSEFQTGSAKRPANRQNRSTIGRQQSNVGLPNGNARPSSLAFPRVSATPMRTPARTPSRSLSKDRGTIIPMTAEKEKAPVDDREFLQMQTNLIREELSKEPIFTDLIQKGLFKSMTLKNFIMILRYFIKPICSLPQDFDVNYIDFVYNLLIQLEYPYSINKSSLKTPNAPHCMNSIIVLIGWLAEFTRIDNEEILYRTSEELPESILVQEFMNHAKEAFFEFNENKSTDEIARKISNLYLEMRVGLGTDVESEISRYKFEIGRLEKGVKPQSSLSELREKQEKSNQLNEQIKAQRYIIDGLNRKISNLKVEHRLKREAEENSIKELNAVSNKLKTQEMTLENHRDLLIEVTQMKSALGSKRDALLELCETGAEREIVLSNLISKKYQLIDRLNNLLYKLVSDLEIAGIKISLDPSEIQIEATKNNEHTDKMVDRLHNYLKLLKDKYSSILATMKEETIKMEADGHTLKTKNDFCEMKIQNQKELFANLENEEHALEEELESFIQIIQSNNHDRTEKIKRAKKEIVERKKGIEEFEEIIEELSEQRVSFGKKAVDECQIMYEQRKMEIENRRADLRNRINLINNYESKKEPLPQHLQKILDEVMARKKAEKKISESKENIEYV